MSSATPRVLVLGATGMLGHVAVEVLAEQGFEVHGTARDLERARRLGVTGCELHPLEATDLGALEAAIDAARPGAAINCIGLVKQLEEASRPLGAIALNAVFPHQAARACAARGVRFVQISTDCVFSGQLDPRAAYAEDHPPDARDLYGLTKLLGEVTEGDALTVRTSMIGWELERAAGLVEWFVRESGPRVSGWAQAIFSGLTTRSLAELLAAVLRDHPGLTGLYHVAAEPITKLELLCRLRDALGLEREIEATAEPCINRALDPSRFEAATGIAVPSWAAMIERLAQEAPRGARA